MEPKSRTRKKKEAQELQEWGEKMLTLSDKILAGLDLPEKLLVAVREAKTLKRREAFRRQMQHIGALMRKVDPEPIRAAVESSEANRARKVSDHKRIEDLRDGLISGTKELEQDIMKIYPDADRRHLSQLIRNARKEVKLDKPPKSARVLFRCLRDLSGS